MFIQRFRCPCFGGYLSDTIKTITCAYEMSLTIQTPDETFMAVVEVNTVTVGAIGWFQSETGQGYFHTFETM